MKGSMIKHEFNNSISVVESILSHCNMIQTRMMILTMFALRLRIVQTCNLRSIDVHETEHKIFLKNHKRSGIKIKNIPADFRPVIYAWKRSCELRGEIYLFSSAKDSRKPVAIETFSHRITALLKKAGLYNDIYDYTKDGRALRKFSPYAIRHASATHMIETADKIGIKVDPFAFAKEMGHSTIQSTMQYIHAKNNNTQVLLNESFKLEYGELLSPSSSKN